MIKRIICGIVQRLISLLFTVGSNSKIKVFMFHQVTNNIVEWKDNEYCITADAFACFLEKALKKYKMEHIDNLIKSVKDLGTYAFVTFDDAYACVYSEAVPILLDKKIPFTLFLTLDFIDKEGYMTTDMIKELSKNPLCTIGAHGKSHKMFRNMSYDEAAFEIKNSKAVLSYITGREINLFAFPYGSIFACSMKSTAILKKEGYKLGFSTIKAPVNKRSIKNRYFIPRYNVNQNNYFRLVR